MASINQVSPVNLDSKQLPKAKKQQAKINLMQLNAYSPNLLENFLDLMAHNNKSVISFGYAPTKHGTEDKQFVPYIPMNETLARPYGQDFDVNTFAPTLSDYAKSKIRDEASSRINGTRPWPKIDQINAWMVTAETDEFKSDGGLGKVAADLPNSFNKKFNKDKENLMSVITPMYVNGKEYKLEYDKAKDKFVYRYGKEGKKTINVEYKGKINVPIYVGAPHNTRLKDIDVRIFTTALQSDKPKPTPHIFLEIPEYGDDANGHYTTFNQFFNILDRNPKATNNNTPYANSEFSDPVFRMAFFSKGVYELMKSIKEGDFKGIEAPNAVLLNDWHAGSLAAMMHYTANAEADTGAISKETGRYFDETPTIYIAHNCEHQGASDGNDNLRTNIFGTLFGAYGVEVKDLIEAVETVDIHGKKRIYANAECKYAYRDSIFKRPDMKSVFVTRVRFSLSKKPCYRLDYGAIHAELEKYPALDLQTIRRVIIKIRQAKLPDPKVLGNAGSFFKNPVVPRGRFEELLRQYPGMPFYEVGTDFVKIPAGWLIEQCGWKGKAFGRASVHLRQALVLVNLGGAQGHEFVALAIAVASSVYDRFHIRIYPEVNIV